MLYYFVSFFFILYHIFIIHTIREINPVILFDSVFYLFLCGWVFWRSWQPEDSNSSPGTRFTGGCELPGGCPEANQSLCLPTLHHSSSPITFNSVSVHMNCRYQKKLEALDSVEVESQEMVTCLLRVVGTQLRSPTRIHAFPSEPFLRAIDLLALVKLFQTFLFQDFIYSAWFVCLHV